MAQPITHQLCNPARAKPALHDRKFLSSSQALSVESVQLKTEIEKFMATVRGLMQGAASLRMDTLG
jgi:hypothetical protein